MPTFTAGQLRNLIRIEQPSTTRDSLGRPSWETFADNVPARIEDVSGKETYIIGRFVDQVSHTVVLRYMTGLSGNMRVIWLDNGNRILEIDAPLNPDGKRQWHVLACTESNA